MSKREFINEVGNKIVVEVSIGDPGRFCRFFLAGPTSCIESYTTRMELEQLRDGLVEALT